MYKYGPLPCILSRHGAIRFSVVWKSQGFETANILFYTVPKVFASFFVCFFKCVFYDYFISFLGQQYLQQKNPKHQKLLVSPRFRNCLKIKSFTLTFKQAVDLKSAVALLYIQKKESYPKMPFQVMKSVILKLMTQSVNF